MHEWTKVVTDPLGLAGFALFLLFGFVAKIKRRDERRWLAPLAAFAGVIALAGGLLIGYVRLAKPTDQAAKAPQQQNSQVQQTSSGAGSPNVQGVQGNVTLTVDQSTGETKTQKTTGSKAAK